MRDVFLKVTVVFALMIACVSTLNAQVVAKADTQKVSAFDRLSNARLMANVNSLGMTELADIVPTPGGTVGILMQTRLQAQGLRAITDPAECLARGNELIAGLEKALDKAEKEMDAAEQAAADPKLQGRPKTHKKIAAAKSVHTYFDMLYLLGDLAGRQAVAPYMRKVMYMQDNTQDRKIVRKATREAVLDLGDMQADLQAAMRDWQGDMSVWMNMGTVGEGLLRNARYWSTRTYLNRALALGDADAHQAELDELKGALQADLASLGEDQTAQRKKRQAKYDAELARLTADQKRRTAERRGLLNRVLTGLGPFEKTKRFGVSHTARHLMSVASRELGNYADAISYLAAPRYQGADAATKMDIAMELALTLAKQGKFDQAAGAITSFKTEAEKIVGRGKPLEEIQQAQIDLKVAILKEYTARRAKRNDQAAAALVEFLDKYKNDGIRQSFIDFFGNRLLYTRDVDKLNSMQLYIIASGASARKVPEMRLKMLKALLGRTDATAKKLAPEAHWQMAMTLNQMGRQMLAAESFVEVMKLLGPDDPKSPQAAQNAAICMEQYVDWIENKGRNAPAAIRLKFVKILQQAVSFDNEKNAKLKLFKWYYSLGQSCNELSKSVTDAKKKVQWMQLAAEAFSKVPTDPPGVYFNAQDLWLDLRYRALHAATEKDAKVMAEAVKLRNDQEKLVKRIEEFVGKLADKKTPQAEALIATAAWVDFGRAKLLADPLKKRAEAELEVAAVLKKWTAVGDVIMSASQWKIQNLIDQGKIAEASAELEAFLKANEDDPGAGAGLLSQVIYGIQKAIGKLEAKGGNDAKLAAYRASYLTLAARLYAPIKGKSVANDDGTMNEDRLNLTQLWIDALIQNGKGAEAMILAEECRRVFNKGRDADAKKIDVEFAGKISLCRKAAGLVGLKRLAIALVADLRSNKLPIEDNARPVRNALKTLTDATNNKVSKEKIIRLKGALKLELETGYREIIRERKKRLPVDLRIEWNYAKCLAATGKYNDALKIYAHLIGASNPRVSKKLAARYWRLQLEWAKIFVEALGNDKERMGKLVKHIEVELKAVGGTELGGYQAEFFAIKEKARRLSE